MSAPIATEPLPSPHCARHEPFGTGNYCPDCASARRQRANALYSRPEYSHPNGALVAVTTVLAALAVVLLVATVLLITGVVVWR